MDSLGYWRRCFQPRQWFGKGVDLDEEDRMMWVYRVNAAGSFEVGYFLPGGDWFADSSFGTREAAAARVRFLNGGNNNARNEDRPTGIE